MKLSFLCIVRWWSSSLASYSNLRLHLYGPGAYIIRCSYMGTTSDDDDRRRGHRHYRDFFAKIRHHSKSAHVFMQRLLYSRWRFASFASALALVLVRLTIIQPAAAAASHFQASSAKFCAICGQPYCKQFNSGERLNRKINSQSSFAESQSEICHFLVAFQSRSLLSALRVSG